MGNGKRKQEQAAYAAFAATLAANGELDVSGELFLLLITNKEHFLAEEALDIWRKLSQRYSDYISKKGKNWTLYAELHAVLGDLKKP